MTRETKIGLLVGLAFIIVVAILLTDHAATTTNPQPAPLAEAGPNVMRSVTTPGVPSVAGVDAPRAVIPTRGELTAPPAGGPPVNVVQVGPNDRSAPPVAVAAGGAAKPSGGDVALPPIEPTRDPISAGKGKPAGRGSPVDLVAQHPNDLTRVGEAGNRAPEGGASATSKTPPLPVTAPKTYVAESGDSINRIAGRMKGGNTKANREALIKANPTLQGDGAMVYVGKSYVIPSPGAAAQAADAPPAAGSVAASGSAVPTTPTKSPTAVLPASTASIPNTAWYTVKDNDNLWRIASRELGDGNLWTQVRDLNRDVLKGGETVRTNMRIRLPKPTATASVN